MRHLVGAIAPQRANGLVHDAAVLQADRLHGVEHVRRPQTFVLLHQRHRVFGRQPLVGVQDCALAEFVEREFARLVLRERIRRRPSSLEQKQSYVSLKGSFSFGMVVYAARRERAVSGASRPPLYPRRRAAACLDRKNT